MSDPVETLLKIHKLPDILAAAELLASVGLLQGREPTSVLKEYVDANPDINGFLKLSEEA